VLPSRSGGEMRASAGLAVCALVAAGLVGCETYERRVTQVTLDRQTEQLSVEVHLNRIGVDLFDCDAGPEDCAVRIEAALASEGESPLAARLRSLTEQGAEGLVLSLTAEGDALDLTVGFVALAGSRAAERSGVSIEHDLRPSGRAKTYLVVGGTDGVLQDAHARRRVRYKPPSKAGDEPVAQLERVCRPSVDAVTLVEERHEGSSMLSQLPGLQDLLAARSLL
jgi:hypothetical protein